MILDSDAVIAFLDRGDALHPLAAATIKKVLPRQRLFVSVVSYAEVLTGARLGHHEEARVKGFFDELISAVLPVEAVIAEQAAQLRSGSRSLRMPDALILATAESSSEVECLVTGDVRAARVPGLRCRVELLA